MAIQCLLFTVSPVMHLHHMVLYKSVFSQLLIIICVQLICGLFQSSGWPPVVAVVANWFGKARFVCQATRLT